MPTVDSYAPGTPSYVDLGSPDPTAAAAFYGGLFGWTTYAPAPPELTGGYQMFQQDGRTVAGLGPQQGPGQPYWTSYVTVADVDATIEAVDAAGGSVLAPAMDVMTAGRMAVLADPEGAAFAVWQACDSIGAELVNEPVSLCWNELNCRRLDDAKAFYGTVFGWGATTNEGKVPTYTEFDLDGHILAGCMLMEAEMFPAEVPAHWMTYFAVADADATAGRCTELGGRVIVPPTDIPPGRFSLLTDPQGAMFSVITMNPDYPS